MQVDAAVGTGFPALEALGNAVDVLRNPEVEIGDVRRNNFV